MNIDIDQVCATATDLSFIAATALQSKNNTYVTELVLQGMFPKIVDYVSADTTTTPTRVNMLRNFLTTHMTVEYLESEWCKFNQNNLEDFLGAHKISVSSRALQVISANWLIGKGLNKISGAQLASTRLSQKQWEDIEKICLGTSAGHYVNFFTSVAHQMCRYAELMHAQARECVESIDAPPAKMDR